MRKIGIGKAEVDSTRIIEDSDEFLVVPAVIAREGVFPYPEGQAFKPAEELKQAAWTADAAWIVAEKHPDTLVLTDRKDIKGRVENSRFCPDINGIIADLRFFKKFNDPKFLADIKAGKRKDVSIGFFYDFDATPGHFKGQRYDFVQRNILIDHVAAGVPVGRCMSPYCGIAVDQLIRKIGLDPEETEDKIHIPVIENTGQFETCRTTDFDGKLPEGVQAVYCKYPDKDEWIIQKYIFDKHEWTMEKAQAWVNEHKGAADSAGEMTLDEIKQKIAELAKKRDEIMETLYPKTTLSEEEQQQLRGELTVLDAELRAFEKILEERIAPQTVGDQEGEPERKREVAKERCGKYPISFKEGKGNITKPEEYGALSEDDFADPCNFKYPMVPEGRLRSAWQRLHQEENRAKGGYSEAEWKWMQNRVKKRMEAKDMEVQADVRREIERAKRLVPLVSVNPSHTS